MRKLFAVVLAVALIGAVVGDVWAAAATVSTTEYGYTVTGGTDETLVKAGRIRVKMITYTGLTANNTVRIRSGATSGASWYMKAVATSDAPGAVIYFGDNGVFFDELSITLTDAKDVVVIYN